MHDRCSSRTQDPCHDSIPHDAACCCRFPNARLQPHKHCLQALTEACRADRSAAVRKAYAAAAALLCRHAPGARVNRFIADALASLEAEDASRDDRYVAGEWVDVELPYSLR